LVTLKRTTLAVITHQKGTTTFRPMVLNTPYARVAIVISSSSLVKTKTQHFSSSVAPAAADTLCGGDCVASTARDLRRWWRAESACRARSLF
jgi:hypothetical protein